ncbi:hypothetical protein I6F21_29790 [Bradyrhizobium sp. NBAIM03]|uniref:hypothetical protein n=1 Tax=Bradyrhizobium sp. NBAIM03 TaxID=2793816 RepID=UPI001CD6DE55|nr:hypothetical protein [Bradyrhizobium sp. NBAIM03]MCA1536722.1 hypothetical protein [Bradyrhizobium sp. NBAIM03]
MKFGPNSRDTIDLAKRMFPKLRPRYEDDGLFIRETSPPYLTSSVTAFGTTIAGRLPLLVDVTPAEGARAGWCFANVAEVVAREGGVAVHGWAIWCCPGLWNAAEFHVVHRTIAGQLRDVTPKPDGEPHIAFVQDSRYPADFDFYQRPNGIRERTLGIEGRDEFVANKVARFSAARMAYETEKAKRKGLTVTQSIGSKMKGRGSYERLVDEFLEEVGELEAMLVPTPEGMVCKNVRRVDEFRRRAADVEKKKTKIFLMADLAVRGMVPGGGA